MGRLGWLIIQLLILAQVMISWFVGLSFMSGSALAALSLLGILCLPLSLLPPARTLAEINIKKKKLLEKEILAKKEADEAMKENRKQILKM